MSITPEIRLRALNDVPVRGDGDYVLYWMVANRRPFRNFSLQRSVELATRLRKPLIVFEALRTNYRWASDRLHQFVIQGMADNQQAFSGTPALYYPYIEPVANAGSGLLESLAGRACAVVTDDFPCFFIPTMLRWAARRLPARLEAIDSNGLLPMREADRDYPSAYAFRRFLHKTLPKHLDQFPVPDPLIHADIPSAAELPAEIAERWPPADGRLLSGDGDMLRGIAIDHNVRPAPFDGGFHAARSTLERFLRTRLSRYAEERNHPDDEAASGLSPYLHFGHLSAHEVFQAVADAEGWSIERIAVRPTGQREGWWGMGTSAESFLDELITWRELGYNMSSHRADYDRYDSLPGWAQETLDAHAHDRREYLYSLDQLESARTHDDLWNAAQTQLVTEGRMHNYLRMLWGKKILEWSESPRRALEVMIELNNKYAVDGRDPNSYSGIFWCLGRYDRPWGPERPIFGKIRYMSSDSTRKKLPLAKYLAKYRSARPQVQSLFADER